jgi:hypothetical protein
VKLYTGKAGDGELEPVVNRRKDDSSCPAKVRATPQGPNAFPCGPFALALARTGRMADQRDDQQDALEVAVVRRVTRSMSSSFHIAVSLFVAAAR